ncbi:MarR family winged helix-turn-helix transcriptional regulator [uncultured Microbacterium sp.]|uniref:MarR family winged helix-turn-helix transcriptional regulator n=1 Tax=uncultured Microbacterium sp. TaxID=191216 RepID=UPI0035C9F8A2
MTQAEGATGPSGIQQAGLTSDLGWALRATSLAFQSWADGAVTDIPSGARGYLVLVAANESVPRSQLTIARQLGIDKTIMTYLVDALVEQSLVERRTDPMDRRVRQLVLTDVGRAALAKARQRLSITEERLLHPLTPPQAEQFRSLLALVAGSARASAIGDCTGE